MKHLYQPVLWSALICLTFLPLNGLFAQNGQELPHPDHYTCGSDWARQVDDDAVNKRTRRENPELFQQLVAHAKKQNNPGSLLASASSDLIDEFWIVNRRTGQREKRTAVSRYVSDNAIIWVDVRDTGRITSSTIDKLVEGLEVRVKPGPNTRDVEAGIIENDIAIFGPPPLDTWTQMEDFVHLFILELEESEVNGYFYPADQDPGILGSNNRNLLYINSRRLLGNPSTRAVDGVLGTIAHELQHLINYRHYSGSGSDRETHWLYNEGLSEVARLRTGYKDRTAFATMGQPNRFAWFDAPIGVGGLDTILAAYERGMLFTHYLSEQFGDGFLKQLVIAGGRNLEPVQNALDAINNDTDPEHVFAEFWVANYLRDNSTFQGDGKYRYRLDVAERTPTTISMGFPSNGIAQEEMQLRSYAAVLPRYANPDQSSAGLNVRFLQSGRKYDVHAVIFRNGGGIDVQRIAIDQNHIIERFTNVVFVVASLAGDGQTVSWTTEQTLVGVDDYSTRAGALSITALAPNPVQNVARIGFRTDAPGTISLSLYDMDGRVVRRVIDAKHYEAGAHVEAIDVTALPDGVYTVHMIDEFGAMSVRQIVIVR